ncbi:MAG: site-2 protease family protein, partial [Christiangramia sp.]|nr:site-2 protease family protein [Christiangramia sp.]
IDIRLRELSKGEMGILDLMKQLSSKYGKDQPFQDDKLIDEIVEITFPQMEGFFKKYVSGTTPIPYDDFFSKVGLEFSESNIASGPFNRSLPDDQPNDFIFVQKNSLIFNKEVASNSFLKELGVKTGDKLLSVNGTAYNAENFTELLKESESWPEETEVVVTVQRKDEEIKLTNTVNNTTRKISTLKEMDLDKNDHRVKLREKWLKG